jgi:hypothetical protein
METSIKTVTGAKSQHGIADSLATFCQRATGAYLQNALPYEMFTQSLPYQATRTYRVMKSELEYKRSAAMIEANRQALRGF